MFRRLCVLKRVSMGAVAVSQLRAYRPVDQSGHAITPGGTNQQQQQPPTTAQHPNTQSSVGYQGAPFSRPQQTYPPQSHQMSQQRQQHPNSYPQHQQRQPYQHNQQRQPQHGGHPNRSFGGNPSQASYQHPGGQFRSQHAPQPSSGLGQQAQSNQQLPQQSHHQQQPTTIQAEPMQAAAPTSPQVQQEVALESTADTTTEPSASSGVWRGLNYNIAPDGGSSPQQQLPIADLQSHPPSSMNEVSEKGVEGDEDEMAEEVEEGEEVEGGEGLHAASPVPKNEVPELKITVKDQNNNSVSVQTLKSFQHLMEEIPPWLAAGIRASGYDAPMPVQATAIPLLMEGRDAVAIAPTGSGKTVAFAIPALASLNLSESVRHRNRASPSVVVMCPTRELVTQTAKVFINLCRGGPIVQAVFGGTDRELQAKHIRKGADVIIAAPGRLCDYLETDVISLDRLDFLVLDEADRMLEMGFAPQLSMIMSSLNKSRPRVTMMWSATWSDTVSGLSKGFLNANKLVIQCEGDGHKANKNIAQHVYMVNDESDRMRQLVSLYSSNAINMDQKVIIFAKRKEEIAELTVQVSRALGFPIDRVAGLHGSLKQGKRAAIIRNFKEGYIRVLVATDVAARGLDVPEIDHVINYDLPLHFDSYVHRIGRTGRAGRKGSAHTIVCSRDSTAIVADLADYYKANSIQTPPELERVFKNAANRNQFRKSRYKEHSKVQGEFWRTKGVDPNAPKKPFHRGGNTFKPSGPRSVNRS